MKRKGQAAMEFLMTYGWAILVVLAAIGALAYLGILNPENWTDGSCQLQGAFRCEDVTLDSTGNLQFVVLSSIDSNSVTATLTDQTGSEVNCTGPTAINITDSGASEVNTSLPTSASPGQRTVVSIDCGAQTVGDRYSGDIAISYVASSGLAKSQEGTIQNIKVQ